MRMLDHLIHYPMKRLITLLILLLSISQLNAQRDLTERRPVWFGVNMGGTWQTSDMKPQAGIGWGITVARYSRISNPSPLYWGWRGRFLDGRNYGYNYHALTGIKVNPVLAGYHSNTDPDTGMVFSNYKMRYDEFAFEIIVGSNSLRKHGVLLYGWGGVGATFWKASTNLTDASGNFYDYSTVNMSGDADLVRADLDGMLDETYEANSLGSGTAGQWGFMPSAGIGFGYQWSNFAIVAEHKTTWALNDLIDGTNHDGAGAATGNNDIYHYAGLTLKWNFNTHHETNNNTNPPPPQPDFTQTQPQPNPNNPNPTPVVNPTPDPNPNNPQPTPTIQPPTVQFTTPSVDPYTATVLNQNLVVRITNISAASQIVLTINNQVQNVNTFSFNPNTQTMTFAHTLQPGNNVYKVVATNNAGSAQDVQTIIYKGQNTPTSPPPVVTITNPAHDPYTSSTLTYSVTATVLNVPNQAAITITRNGSPVTIFSYNQQTNVVTLTASLQSGANLYKIVGTNSVGTASDEVTINYGSSNSGLQPPVVTITTPNACPYSTKTQAQSIAATITNVSAANQVTVVFNNQPVTNFMYSQRGANANISFNVQLVSGANPFTINATNTAGADAESCTITYKPNTTLPPPDVNITTPSSTPSAQSNPAFTLKATVLNVASSSEITVTSNNAVIVGWTYDMNSKVLTYTTTLPAGTTNYVVTATNANGTDSDNHSVSYKVNTPTVIPPDVNITTPSSTPYTTSAAAFTLKATVLNVAGASEITVTVNNGAVQGWSYDMNSKVLTYNTNVAVGTTNFVVTASNANGTDSDNQSVVYRSNTPGVLPPTVNITSPTANPFVTTSAAQTLTATVLNVTQQNQITVKKGNTSIPFTFNATSHVVTFSVTLSAGANTYNVTATNTAGTASDNTTLNLNGGPAVQTEPVVGRPPQGSAPSIDLHVPSASPVNTGTQTFPVIMIVSGVTSQSDITVKVNNVVLTSGVTFNASSGQLSFTAALNQGTNNISVRAQNAAGTVTKPLVVNYTAGSRIGQEPEPKKTVEQPIKEEEPKKTYVPPPPPTQPKEPKAEPAKAEPKKAEPKSEPKPAPKAEPKKEETKKAEPAKAETKPAPAPAPAPAPSRGTTTPTPARPR